MVGGWRTAVLPWDLPGFTTHHCGRICNAQRGFAAHRSVELRM